METRSRETTPTKEDLDFIVDDGYKHDEDPDYVPNEKYVVTGSEFKMTSSKAQTILLCCSREIQFLGGIL